MAWRHILIKVEISDSSPAYQSYLKQVTLTLRHFLITLQLSTKRRETSIVGLADLRGSPGIARWWGGHCGGMLAFPQLLKEIRRPI
jgi:hypothetical protein